MSRLPTSLALVLLFLSACSQTPSLPTEAAVTETFTPWAAGTETAFAASQFTPTPVPSWTPFPTSTPLPVPIFTQPAQPPFPTFTPPSFSEGTFSPILYGSGPFLLIGGSKMDHGWLTGMQAAQYIGADAKYDFFSPIGTIQVQGNALEFSPTCSNHFMPASVSLPEPMVGVTSGWIPERRPARDLAVDDPVYVRAVAEWFQSQGNDPSEIHITRILQVDLEGDGVNEVLLSATYFKNTDFTFLTETGDYSVVLMRKVMGNDVITVPLVKDYYVSSVPNIEISYPNTYTLADALDLNRDGTLEVIVDVRRWEGGGAIVYRVDGLNVREVLRTIC